LGHGSNVGQVSNLSSDGHEKFAAIPMTGWKPVLRKSGILNHAKIGNLLSTIPYLRSPSDQVLELFQFEKLGKIGYYAFSRISVTAAESRSFQTHAQWASVMLIHL